MENLQERLHQFLKVQNINMKAFETQCQIGQGLGTRLSEKSYATTFNRISKAFPQLNIDWLKTGQGEMLQEVQTQPLNLELTMYDHGQFSLGNITNIGTAKTALVALQSKLNMLEEKYQRDLDHKDELIDLKTQEIAGKTEQFERELAAKDATIKQLEKMLDYFMKEKSV